MKTTFRPGLGSFACLCFLSLVSAFVAACVAATTLTLWPQPFITAHAAWVSSPVSKGNWEIVFIESPNAVERIPLEMGRGFFYIALLGCVISLNFLGSIRPNLKREVLSADTFCQLLRFYVAAIAVVTLAATALIGPVAALDRVPLVGQERDLYSDAVSKALQTQKVPPDWCFSRHVDQLDAKLSLDYQGKLRSDIAIARSRYNPRSADDPKDFWTKAWSNSFTDPSCVLVFMTLFGVGAGILFGVAELANRLVWRTKRPFPTTVTSSQIGITVTVE